MSRTTVSIWRESSARALVAEIVRDWLKEAIFFFFSPIKASSGMLVIASLIDRGILLFALRPVWLAEAELVLVEPEFLLVDAEAVSPFALLFDAHDTVMKVAIIHAHTNRFFFILLLLIKIYIKSITLFITV
jgi:hypothetical protein